MLLIAICDDAPIECTGIAKQIEALLKQLRVDFIIKRFFNGEELLHSCESFDIIFLDIKMPGINGMVLAKKIREQGRQSLIIFITAAKEYVFEAYDVEAFQYLIKPVQKGKLKNVLEKSIKKIQADTNINFLILSADRETKKYS